MNSSDRQTLKSLAERVSELANDIGRFADMLVSEVSLEETEMDDLGATTHVVLGRAAQIQRVASTLLCLVDDFKARGYQ